MRLFEGHLLRVVEGHLSGRENEKKKGKGRNVEEMFFAFVFVYSACFLRGKVQLSLWWTPFSSSFSFFVFVLTGK